MQMPKYMAEKSYSDKGHGECFQTIYRYLREGLVNPSIKAKMEYTGVAA